MKDEKCSSVKQKYDMLETLLRKNTMQQEKLKKLATSVEKQIQLEQYKVDSLCLYYNKRQYKYSRPCASFIPFYKFDDKKDDLPMYLRVMFMIDSKKRKHGSASNEANLNAQKIQQQNNKSANVLNRNLLFYQQVISEHAIVDDASSDNSDFMQENRLIFKSEYEQQDNQSLHSEMDAEKEDESIFIHDGQQLYDTNNIFDLFSQNKQQSKAIIAKNAKQQKKNQNKKEQKQTQIQCQTQIRNQTQIQTENMLEKINVFIKEKLNESPYENDYVALAKEVNYILSRDFPEHVSKHKHWQVTGLRLYQLHMHNQNQQKNANTTNLLVEWSEEDDAKLKKAVQIHGTDNNWQQISYNLEPKTAAQCFQRWFKHANPQILRKNWDVLQDIRLILCIASVLKGFTFNSNDSKLKKIKWIDIAKYFNNRTDVQLRERYCNILDPNLENRSWDEEEDRQLIQNVNAYGKKWAKISTMCSSFRTDNQCRRRHTQIINRLKQNKILNEQNYYESGNHDIQSLNVNSANAQQDQSIRNDLNLNASYQNFSIERSQSKNSNKSLQLLKRLSQQQKYVRKISNQNTNDINQQ